MSDVATAAPPFDPAKPFEVEGMAKGGKPPPFNPKQPFQVEATAPAATPQAPAAKPQEASGPGMLDVAAHALPFGPGLLKMADMAGLRSPRELEVSDEGVDTSTGAPFSVRKQLSRANNDKEAEKMLGKYYKPGEFGRDKEGKWWILGDSVDGTRRRLRVEPEGSISSAVTGLGAQMLGDAPAMAGATVGAEIGALGGPLAPFTVPAGVGIGWVAGRSLDELSKHYEGFYDKTPKELAGKLAWEGAFNTALTTLAPAARAAMPWIKKNFFGVTPESSAMAKDVMQPVTEGFAPGRGMPGAIPPIGSVATEAAGLEAKRQLTSEVSGDMTLKRNVQWLESNVSKFLQESGFDQSQARGIIKEIAEGATAVDPSRAATSIVTAAERGFASLQRDVDTSLAAARQGVGNITNIVTQWSRGAPETLGMDIGTTIIAGRRAMSQIYREGYGALSAQAGNAPIVGIAAPREIALELAATNPYVPRLVRDVSQQTENMTFEQAHNLRSEAREAMRNLTRGSLTPPPEYYMYGRLERAVDGEITRLADSGQVPGIAENLRRLDRAYHTDIAQFDNLTVKQLARDIRDGATPDPWRVAREIIEPGKTQDARLVARLLTPEQRNSVGQAFIESMHRASTRDGVINPETLMRNLERFRDPLGAFLPRSFLDNYGTWVRQLRALNGRVTPDELPPGRITDAIRDWTARTRAMNDFVESNPLGAFRSGDAQAQESAMALLTNPKARVRLPEIMSQMRPEERTEVHRFMLQKLFAEAIETTPARGRAVTGEAVKKFLGAYTPEQQATLFPQGMAPALNRLGDKISFIFPEAGADAGKSQTAMSVKSRGFLNPIALPKRISWYLTTLAIHNQPVLSWFADIAERDPTLAKKVMGAFGRWAANSTVGGPSSSEAGQ